MLQISKTEAAYIRKVHPTSKIYSTKNGRRHFVPEGKKVLKTLYDISQHQEAKEALKERYNILV